MLRPDPIFLYEGLEYWSNGFILLARFVCSSVYRVQGLGCRDKTNPASLFMAAVLNI